MEGKLPVPTMSIQNKQPGILERADHASCIAGAEESQQAIVEERLLDRKVLAGVIQLCLDFIVALILLIRQLPELIGKLAGYRSGIVNCFLDARK